MTKRSGWTDSNLSRLRLEGLDHLNRLHSGEATDRDAAALIAWRNQSRAHEEAFRSAIRLRALVRRVETTAGLEKLPADAQNVVPITAGRVRRFSRREALGGALAASVAASGWWIGRTLQWVPSPSEALADYRTGPGEQRTVRLQQGASVALNTRTAIDLRMDGAMPTVELVAGEVSIATGHAPGARLFAAGGVSTLHAGRMNARRDGHNVCITCIAGAVTVAWGGEEIELKRADQIRYDAEGLGAVLSGVSSAAVSAWQSGTLIFNGMPLRNVVDELNRYRAGRVFLINQRLGDRTLSGTYYINRLDDFFRQAELALGVRVTRYPGDIVVLS